MTDTQKIILVALLVVGALCVLVGLVIGHHIGGFMRVVEEEAREEAERAGKPDARDDSGDGPAE